MRTMSATLAGAVRATGRQPAAQIKLADDREHYALYRSDTTPKAMDGCAACAALDGSLVRAALFDNGAAGNADVAVQRITDPSQASQWTAWTTLSAGNCQAVAPLALSLNPGGVLRLFYADGPSSGATLKLFESTSQGATWSGPSTLYPGTNSYGYLASAGNDDLFACRETALGAWDVQFFQKVGGAWQPPVAWPLGSLSLMYGLAAARSGSLYFLALSAWHTSGLSIEAYQFDGSTGWQDLNFVAPLDGSNLGFQFRWPSLLLDNGTFRLSYVQHDDGSIDGLTSDRVLLARSIDFTHWTSGRPVSGALARSAGAALVTAFGSRFVTSPTDTFSAPVYSPSDVSRNSDLSGQIQAYERKESLLTAGHYQVAIGNEGGQNNALPGLVPDGTLSLSEGYVTSAGMEVLNVATAVIDHWYFNRAAGESQLIIVARDQSHWLDVEAPLLLSYSGRNLLWLATEIAARAGLLQVFWPGTPAMSQVLPSFAVQPGQTWREALHRLVEAYGLDYIVRADGSLVLHDPSESTASSWTWQAEMHSGHFGQAAAAANHVRVFGQGCQADAWDQASLEAAGVERYRHVVDRALTSAAQAGIRAGNELLLEARKERGGQIHVPVNPGIEVLDVVTLVDVTTATNQTYRCQGISDALDVVQGSFEMTLDLTGV